MKCEIAIRLLKVYLNDKKKEYDRIEGKQREPIFKEMADINRELAFLRKIKKENGR